MVAVVSTAQAEMFTFEIPYMGPAPYGSRYQTLVDFGQSFSSVESVSITWSGRIRAGLVYSAANPLVGYPVPGSLTALLKSDDGTKMREATVRGGADVYPDFYYFDCTTTLTPYMGRSSFDFLLDGETQLDLDWAVLTGIPENPHPTQPYCYLTLIIPTVI